MAALVALVSVGASVARTLYSGQDVNFDLISYHYYLGFSAFTDRLALDYLPAGLLGYQSPLPYALLYLLDSAGLAPIANAALHAALHSLSLFILFLITRLTLRGTLLEQRPAACIAFWLLGALAPMYWQLVGTSFAEALTSVLLLGALWLVAEALPAPQRRGSLVLLALGAALAGIAVAARLHSGAFVVALGCALLFMRFPERRTQATYLGVFSATAVSAWLLCFGPWAWRVFGEFGNPVFPLLNAFFASPDFPAANLQLVSTYAPKSVAEAILFPFRMALPQDASFGEKPLADLRPALVVVAAAAWGASAALRRLRSRDASLPASVSSAPPATRLVMSCFLIAALLWLATSAHSRYGMALLLLAGPIGGLLLQRALPGRYAIVTASLAALVQAGHQLVSFEDYRWASTPWSARYFDWEPLPAPGESALYLSFGYQTASSVAPRLDPSARHANLVGVYSLGVDHPGAQRLQRLIEAPGRRIYGVFDHLYSRQGDPAAKSMKTYFADHLHLWGLAFAAAPCGSLGLRPASPQWREVNRVLGVAPRGSQPQFVVCELQPASSAEHEAAATAYRSFARRIAPLAAGCPRVLGGPVSIVRAGSQWQVTSFASVEFRLEFEDDGSFQLQLLRPPYTMLPLGKVTEKEILVRDPDCGAWVAKLQGR